MEVTDGTGCTTTTSYTITEPTELELIIGSTPITCYGNNDATIALNISGGTAPYTVESDLGTDVFYENLPAGQYSFTITDSAGCQTIEQISIPEADVFTISPAVTDVTCNGANDGNIELNITGGDQPLNIVWDDSEAIGAVRTNLAAGAYNVTVTEAGGCQISATFTIVEPDILSINGTVTSISACNEEEGGSIELDISGGTETYNYLWSNGSTTKDLEDVSAGNYTVNVTDAAGCEISDSFSIEVLPPLVLNVQTETIIDCDINQAIQNFQADVSGGTAPYTFVWSSGDVSGDNDEIMSASQNGEILLEATDANGCSAVYTYTVDLPVIGEVSFDVDSESYRNTGSFSINDPIQFTNTSSGDYVDVNWDFGDGTFSNQENPTHIYANEESYEVIQSVTYPSECIKTYSYTINLNDSYNIIIPNAFTPNGDGMNDYFVPVYRGFTTITLNVYDTWGSMIYSETGADLRGWDGYIKGNEAENGNYYYTVTGMTITDEAVEERGVFICIK